MEYTRWYDKNEQLKLIMEAFELVGDHQKLDIADDIIQTITEQNLPETDELIENLNAEYIPIRRRWYDKFESLHSAVEMLKQIDNEENREVLQDIMYSIFYFSQCAPKGEEE